MNDDDPITGEFADFLAKTGHTITSFHRWIIRQGGSISTRWLQHVKAGNPPTGQFDRHKVDELRHWMHEGLREHITSIDPRLGELFELDDDELQAITDEALRRRRRHRT